VPAGANSFEMSVPGVWFLNALFATFVALHAHFKAHANILFNLKNTPPSPSPLKRQY
jgi:hypothetical protein